MMSLTKMMKISKASAPLPLLPSVNSPAATVKEGRERGLSVLDKLRAQEQEQTDAQAAVAAKRRKRMTVGPLSMVSAGKLVRASPPENGDGSDGDGSGSDVEWTPARNGSKAGAKASKKSGSKARAAAARGLVQVRSDVPNGVGIQGRGRAAVNVKLNLDGGSCLPTMLARKKTLLEKVESRPMRAMVAVAPAGLGSLDEMPDRDNFAAGEAGNVAFDAAWAQYNDEHCSRRGGQTRSEDQHELKAGWFGFWHERRGHGKCVEWIRKANGYALQMVEADGLPVVPRVGAVCEFASLMARGSKEKCPKGGWAEYRSGPWYKMAFGHEQGDFLREDNEKEYGHGAYADQPCRFTTIEQKLSGMRLWYDDKLKHTNIANPFRNQQVLDLMAEFERQMGRAVAYKPKMLKPATLKATQGEVNLESAQEVGMVLYMSNNVIKGTRAADEYNADWTDVGFHEETDERAAAATYRNQATKNNKKQVDVPPKVLHCTSACTGKVERTDDGKLELKTFCPVHLAMHLQTLQARDAGVSVDDLKGPLFGDYVKVKKVPAGATLRMLETGSVSDQAGPLVCKVTKEQEFQGMCYDRSQPFVVNGKQFWPPARGVWVEKAGGYAVYAWATANGVTRRFRKQLRTTNRRAGKVVISEEDIAKSSSKTFRITMATLLTRYNIPMAEVVEMGEWEDEEMARRYIELQDALAPDRRNFSDVMYGGYAQGEQASGSAVPSTEVPPEAPPEPPEAPPEPDVPEGQAMAPPDPPPQPDVQDVDEVGLFIDTAELMEMLMPSGGVPGSSVSGAGPAGAGPSAAESGPSAAATPTVVAGSQLVVAESKKRRAEADPQYKHCCNKYRKNTLKHSNINGNVVLQGLLELHRESKPEVVWRTLCGHDFHTTRKEITNYRGRLKRAAAAAAGNG